GALLLHAAARRVHEDRAALHEAERALVDHTARLVGERRVAREQIGLRQQRVQAAHRLGAAPADLIVGDIRVEGEYAHAQRAGELRHEAPDIADADDAERFALQLGVAALPRAPVALARPAVDLARALGAH